MSGITVLFVIAARPFDVMSIRPPEDDFYSAPLILFTCLLFFISITRKKISYLIEIVRLKAPMIRAFHSSSGGSRFVLEDDKYECDNNKWKLFVISFRPVRDVFLVVG